MALTNFGPAFKGRFCLLSDLKFMTRGLMALTNFAPSFKVIFCHLSDLRFNDRGVMTLSDFGLAFKVLVFTSLNSWSRIEV